MVPPSLPQSGRQSMGCIPLTPIDSLVILMRSNHNVGACPGGGGGDETKCPKEHYDLIFFQHFSRAGSSVFHFG